MSNITVTYSDKEYNIKKMNPLQALSVIVKLRKLVGNNVVEAFQGMEGMSQEEIGMSMMVAMTSDIEEDQLTDLLTSLFKFVTVTLDDWKCRVADANQDFASLPDMAMVAYECIKHNFGGFLAGFLPSSN